MNKVRGIYGICINNKWYIGSTIDYNRRIKEHISNLQLRKHENAEMQNEYNIIKTADCLLLKEIINLEKELSPYENYFIGKYNSLDNGFNKILSNRKNEGFPFSEKLKIKKAANALKDTIYLLEKQLERL